MENNVRIPPITSLRTAIELFYTQTELGNSEITQLFGKHSPATIVRLKKKAQQKMAELNIQSWNSNRVSTTAAYAAWGLDISDLERRYEKVRQLA